MKEIWNSVDSTYEVSIDGNVRNSCSKRELVQTMGNGQGRYRKVSLGVNNRQLVHRLVATEFIPNPNNKPHVNHLDKDTTNNHVDNLQWATVRENNIHMGGKEYQIIKDGVGMWFPCIGDIARHLDANGGNISRFVRGIKYKTYKGWSMNE